MKKLLPAYAISWALVLGLFNLITFVTPGDKFDDAMFTISYVLITLFFLVLLGCACYAFGAQNQQNIIYRYPLFKKSIGALVAILIFGSIFMAIDGMPTWLGAIIIASVAVWNVLPMLKVVAASGIVESIDRQVKQQTVFIKMFTADAQVLMGRAQGTVNAENVRKVYEAVRYSDPMSSQGLMDVENRMRGAFGALIAAVEAGAPADVETATMLSLIEERNIKCKILK